MWKVFSSFLIANPIISIFLALAGGYFNNIESIKFSHELIALQREYSCPASQTSFIGNKQKYF